MKKEYQESNSVYTTQTVLNEHDDGEAVIPNVRNSQSDGYYISDKRLNDAENATRLATQYNNVIRYVEDWGWMAWNGKYWERDKTGEVMRLAKNVARGIYQEAANAITDSDAKKLSTWANNSLSHSKLRAMVELAKSEPGIAAIPEDFDTHPHLLNVENGILDLNKGQLMEHDPKYLITHMAGPDYDPISYSPLWQTFLDQVMGEDHSLINYLQSIVGYTLSGDTSEQVLFFLYGIGSNGKSTLIETLTSLLGSYQKRVSIESLMGSRQAGSASEDLARLAGARMITTSEIPEGKSLNESLVKDLTGRDTISARHLRKSTFEYVPDFKLWMYGNHKPRINGTDDGIWRRIRLIEFGMTISEEQRDLHLLDKLEKELPGILNWAIYGYSMWKKNGLLVPDKIRDATSKYRNEMDVLASFIHELCIVHPNVSEGATNLYNKYKQYCADNGETYTSQKVFGEKLREKGFDKKRNSQGRYVYCGISLN